MPIATSTLIAAGVATAASAAGKGIAARKRKKAEKEQRRILDGMNRDNEQDFLRDYYQDAFDDPSSRSYLKRISGELYDRNKGIENSGIATGATHENVQAQKQASNEVMSDAVNNVVVNHEAKKAVAKDQYVQRKDAIASGNMELAARKGERQAQTWEGIGDTISSGVSMIGAGMQGGGRMIGGNKRGKPKLNSSAFNQMSKSSADYANSIKPVALTGAKGYNDTTDRVWNDLASIKERR